MSGNLRINGATSGYSQLAAPDVAGDQTFTFPGTGGELATKAGGGPAAVGYQQGLWTPTINTRGEDSSRHTSSLMTQLTTISSTGVGGLVLATLLTLVGL